MPLERGACAGMHSLSLLMSTWCRDFGENGAKPVLVRHQCGMSALDVPAERS
jgi:hypothetical protein